MSEKRPTIYAIDFDGTICTNKWPEIGEPIQSTVNYILAIQEHGDQWILWTMRDGERLDEALKWLDQHGLHPDAVNDNLPQMKAFYGNNPRKVFANYYIDDHNACGLILPPLPNRVKDDEVYETSGYAGHLAKFDTAAQILSGLLQDLRKIGEETLRKYVEDFVEGVGYAELEIDQMLHPEHYSEDINDL